MFGYEAVPMLTTAMLECQRVARGMGLAGHMIIRNVNSVNRAVIAPVNLLAL